jgi:hypothetical protein
MRVTSSVLCLGIGACSMPALGDEPLDRCSVTECFNRHQVREYEVVDNTTIIIYVGGQRCPFLVEFDGTFCDLTFMPGGNIAFVTSGVRQMDMRICARDRHIGIDEGVFSTAPGGQDASPSGRPPCQIRDVASLTDDQVLELYVDSGITAPPPPFGTGQIQVGESEGEDEGEEGASSSEDDN